MAKNIKIGPSVQLLAPPLKTDFFRLTSAHPKLPFADFYIIIILVKVKDLWEGPQGPLGIEAGLSWHFRVGRSQPKKVGF